MRGPLATATPYRSLQIPAPVIPAKAGIHPLPRVGAIRESPSPPASPPLGETERGVRRRRAGARRAPSGSSPNGGLCVTRPYPSFPRARESIPSRRGAPRGRPLPPRRGSFALSRWERVGVRAGGGGGRATLPANRITQGSPLGDTERGRAPLGARTPAGRP